MDYKAKILSGRWLLTVLVGLTYAFLACQQFIPIDKVSEITLLVFYAYFTKPRTNNTTPPKE